MITRSVIAVAVVIAFSAAAATTQAFAAEESGLTAVPALLAPALAPSAVPSIVASTNS